MRHYHGIGLSVLCVMLFSADRSEARTTREVDQTCPLDGSTFKAWLDFSGTTTGQRLDLKPLGPTPAPWRLAVCPKCGFVLFKEELTVAERSDLRAFVRSPEYQRHVEGNSSYYLLAKIFEHLEKPMEEVGFAYLKASWQVEDDAAKYQKYLGESLSAFEQAILAPAENADLATIELLCVELRRLSGDFAGARAMLERLRRQPERQTELGWLLDQEEELIADKNSEPQAVVHREKGSGWRASLVARIVTWVEALVSPRTEPARGSQER